MASVHRVVAAALIGICAVGTGAAVVAQDEERGREIAEAACSPCHAVGKTGSSPNPKAPLFRELSRKYPLEDLEESLAEGILTGHPEMPQVRMSPNDIGAFIDYLHTIQSKK